MPGQRIVRQAAVGSTKGFIAVQMESQSENQLFHSGTEGHSENGGRQKFHSKATKAAKMKFRPPIFVAFAALLCNSSVSVAFCVSGGHSNLGFDSAGPE
jgi:hypothetical protein